MNTDTRINISDIYKNISNIVAHLVGDADYISGFRDALNEVIHMIDNELTSEQNNNS